MEEGEKLDDRTMDLVAQFVDCSTYEECRDFLVTHYDLITKDVSDSLFEKGYLVLASHPPQFGARFIRQAQIINYLNDIRQASSGQQDISLFFHRILGDDPSFRRSFELQVKELVEKCMASVAKHKDKLVPKE